MFSSWLQPWPLEYDHPRSPVLSRSWSRGCVSAVKKQIDLVCVDSCLTIFLLAFYQSNTKQLVLWWQKSETTGKGSREHERNGNFSNFWTSAWQGRKAPHSCWHPWAHTHRWVCVLFFLATHASCRNHRRLNLTPCRKTLLTTGPTRKVPRWFFCFNCAPLILPHLSPCDPQWLLRSSWLTYLKVWQNDYFNIS